MMDDLLRYTLRISPQLMQKFEFVARYNGRTKNKELEQLIKKAINDFEETHGKIEIESK